MNKYLTLKYILIWFSIFGCVPASAAPDLDSKLDIRKVLDANKVKLVAVEFYRTDCQPCMDAVPRWDALHEKYRSRGLRLIVVNSWETNERCAQPGWRPDKYVCDLDGSQAKRFGVNEVPNAFLWSWQGNLLVEQGHIEEIEVAIERYFKKNPRIQIHQVNGPDNNHHQELFDLIQQGLIEVGKFQVVKTDEQLKSSAKLRAKISTRNYQKELQIAPGREVPANSVLTARLQKGRLTLELLAADGRYDGIGSVTVPYNPQIPESSVKEAIQKLIEQKSNLEIQMPGGQSISRRMNAIPESPKVEPVRPKTRVITLVDVNFESQPAGASVLVNNKMICQKTPCSKQYALGRRLRIQFQKERYLPSALQVVVSRDMGKIQSNLAPDFGLLSVKTNPAGLDIALNGKVIGETPVTKHELDVGRHRLEIRSPKHKSHVEYLEVGQNEHIQKQINPVARTGQMLVIATDSHGNTVAADVYLDGEYMGKTPYKQATMIGEHYLQVDYPKHSQYKKQIKIFENKQNTFDAEFSRRQIAGAITVGAGNFRMGCLGKRNERCQRDETPYGVVYLDTFKLDKTEVTVDMYQECVDAGICTAPDHSKPLSNWDKPERGNHPVNGVSWYQAKSYCEWRGKRLPTEAEWEKAARGGSTWTYVWGNSKPNCTLAVMAAETQKQTKGTLDPNYRGQDIDGCYEKKTWPVCSKPEGNSPRGLCDMAGNVWEWTSDFYAKTYKESRVTRPTRKTKVKKQSPTKVQKKTRKRKKILRFANPKGAPRGGHKVTRGGSFVSGPKQLRISRRMHQPPKLQSIVIGFRCAE